MKKIISRSLLLIIFLLLAGGTYLFFSLNSLVKKAVEHVGPRIIGVDVRLGAALISPWSGSGKLTGLTVGNPPGYATPFALSVGSISVSVEKKSLLEETVVINEIIIRNPELNLEGTLSGNNLGKILDNLKSRSQSAKGKEEAGNDGKSKMFIVKEVVIPGTKLHVAASAMNQKVEQSLSIPEIRLKNIGSAGNGAISQGIDVLSRQGIKELQNRGIGELRKALPGLFK